MSRPVGPRSHEAAGPKVSTDGHDCANPAEVPAAVVVRLEELPAFTEARVEEGQEHLRSHVELYRRYARWIDGHADRPNDTAD
jgi:hypothetical protein